MPSPDDFDVEIVLVRRGRNGQPFAIGREVSGSKEFFFDKRWVSRKELKRDDRVIVRANPPSSKHPKSWYVLDIPIVPLPGVTFEDWQTSTQLPETRPGQQFQHIHFACYCCGETLVSPKDIHKIKGGSIWTRGTPATLEAHGSPHPNRFKGEHVQDARCKNCDACSLGAYYKEPYKNSDDKAKVFPCFKLMFQRTTKHDPSHKTKVTALAGDETEVKLELERLKATSPLQTATRVDELTRPFAEQLRTKDREMGSLVGTDDAVWKFPQALLERVKPVSKQLTSRPSVSIAPLNLHRDADVVQKLLTEAGGPTAKQPNPGSPFGKTLAAVAITHDKQKEAAFNGALARNKVRYKGHLASGQSHPFSPKYKHSTSTKEPTNEEEKQVLRHVTCGTVYNLLDPALLEQDPPLRLQRVFHGVTSWGAVVGILGGDFASLQQLDSGWYGSGFYFSPDLNYALEYTRVCAADAFSLPDDLHALGLQQGEQCRIVLACDVQYGSPYPVLDAKKCKGQPLVSGHDAHVAVVDPATKRPYDSHHSWSKGGPGRFPLAEIVLSDPSCVLVRAVLIFKA